ncbi:MAG TPA: hypothetical protein VGL90_13630, partial [Casimicrobiaceae bacterium]
MWEPNADRAAAAKLGDALRALSYDDETIEDLLDDDALAADLSESVVYARRLDDDETSHTIRLLL